MSNHEDATESGGLCCAVRFIGGTLKRHTSSGAVNRGFCGDCGSPIAAQHADRAYAANWVGTLDDAA